MRQRNVSIAAHLALHNAALVPTLLTGSVKWVLQKKNERKMLWRCDFIVIHAAQLIESVGMSLWEWRRTCSAGLFMSNECVMKEWQKIFMMEKWAISEVGGGPRLTFENTVSKILEEGHVKSMRTPRMYEAKEVFRDRSVWRCVLSYYPARNKAWS